MQKWTKDNACQTAKRARDNSKNAQINRQQPVHQYDQNHHGHQCRADFKSAGPTVTVSFDRTPCITDARSDCTNTITGHSAYSAYPQFRGAPDCSGSGWSRACKSLRGVRKKLKATDRFYEKT